MTVVQPINAPALPPLTLDDAELRALRGALLDAWQRAEEALLEGPHRADLARRAGVEDELRAHIVRLRSVGRKLRLDGF
jgi:hypothetical protein